MIKVGAPLTYFALPGTGDVLATDNIVQYDADGRIQIFYASGGGTYYWFDTFSTVAAMLAGPGITVPLYGFIDIVGNVDICGRLTWDGHSFRALTIGGTFSGFAGADATIVAARYVSSTTTLSPPWLPNGSTPYLIVRGGGGSRTLIAVQAVNDVPVNSGPADDLSASALTWQAYTSSTNGSNKTTFEAAVFNILPLIP